MKAFHLDGKDLVCEGIQVLSPTFWLDLQDDEGLGLNLRISEYLVNDVRFGFIDVLDDFTCNTQEFAPLGLIFKVFAT